MPVDFFFPPRAPSTNGTQATVTPRMITNKFGDGFKQDTPDGINALERTQTLTWDPIAVSEADAIEEFLDEHIGLVFKYTLPNQQAPRTWIWTQRQRSSPYAVQDSLVVTIEERFVY